MPFNSHCSLKKYSATQTGKRSHDSYLGIAVTGYLEGATSVGKHWLWLLVSAHPGGEGMAGSSAHHGGNCEGCSHQGRADIRKSMAIATAEL